LSDLSDEFVEELVLHYGELMADYEDSISRAKTTKSDRKRLLFVTDAELAYKAAQRVKKDLLQAGFEVRRSM
jgi:hypothetical protein